MDGGSLMRSTSILRQRFGQGALIDIRPFIVKGTGGGISVVVHQGGIAVLLGRRDVARGVDGLFLLLQLVGPVARDAHAPGDRRTSATGRRR